MPYATSRFGVHASLGELTKDARPANKRRDADEYVVKCIKNLRNRFHSEEFIFSDEQMKEFRSMLAPCEELIVAEDDGIYIVSLKIHIAEERQ